MVLFRSPQKMELTKLLEAVNQISHDSSAIEASLELQKASSSTLPFSLSQTLSKLANAVQNLHNSKPSKQSNLISFVTRQIRSHEVSRLAAMAESELNLLIDIESVPNLTKTLSLASHNLKTDDAHHLFDEMSHLQNRLSKGFNIHLQHLLLKSGVFAQLERVLTDPNFAIRVREKAAILIKELLLFNKDVFVGLVLAGGTVKALVSMDSLISLQILTDIIKAIKSPLVDIMDVSKIVDHLSSEELEMRLTAMDCVMEIGYFGRKEAIEAMINGGLVRKLVELQMKETKTKAFCRCVARFAVQLEVGEGLRQREKRGFKLIILEKVREACVNDAEAATIVAEVLWGSSP